MAATQSPDGQVFGRQDPVTRSLAVMRPHLAFRWQSLVNVAMALAAASGGVAFIEPSPYDVLVVIAFAIWMFGGFRVHFLVVPLAALIFSYNAGGFLALLPYLDEPDPTTFMVQSVYLAFTCVLFAVFFSENAAARAEAVLKGYALGCIVAGAGAIVGYFNIGGFGDRMTLYGRASSFFKDPNVLGSYLVLGALYYVQLLMLGRTRRPLMTVAGLLMILAGVFLSFSRGSWGVLVGSTTLMTIFALLTNGSPRVRRRVVLTVALAVGLAAVLMIGLLSIGNVREMLSQRAELVQDYDGGQTGRFGNQLRSIPMLLERVNGFGPVRFRLFFPEDSHSSYIGSFSSYGWLGGASFLLIVGLTTVVGLRLVMRPSPVQQMAQVFWPCLFAIQIQAFQIDIDHWRHVYLMLGAVWGLEAARRIWERRQAFPEADLKIAPAGVKPIPAAPVA